MSREEEEFQGDSSAPQKEQPVSVQEEEEEGDLILGAEDVAEEINDVNTMEGEEEDEGDGDEEMGEGQDDEEDMMNQGMHYKFSSSMGGEGESGEEFPQLTTLGVNSTRNILKLPLSHTDMRTMSM